jgi:hypothetical protein
MTSDIPPELDHSTFRRSRYFVDIAFNMTSPEAPPKAAFAIIPM